MIDIIKIDNSVDNILRCNKGNTIFYEAWALMRSISNVKGIIQNT